MNKKPKLMVMGYGRHGKDTVCEILKKDYKFSFVSSSLFLANNVIWPAIGRDYKSVVDCYEDRHNHRALWFELAKFYNKDNKARLSEEIFKEADIYCGIRSASEFYAAKDAKLFDHAIWVDRSSHIPRELDSSCSVAPEMCNYILDNNDTIPYLKNQIASMVYNLEL